MTKLVIKNSSGGGAKKSAFTLAEGATHVAHCDKFRRVAFTLAEVLITLGIIGVVAAITIPSIVQKFEEKKTVSQVMKAYSEISQAYTTAVEEIDTPDNWGLVIWTANDDVDEHNILYHIRPYLKISQYCGSKQSYSCWAQTKAVTGITFGHNGEPFYSRAVLADGTSILSMVTRPTCTGSTGQINNTCGIIRIDVNGKKPPNLMGRDVFSFWVTKDKILPTGSQLEGAGSGTSFENGCVGGAEGRGCTAWLLYNENMDYLHCPDKLGWNKAKKCRD